MAQNLSRQEDRSVLMEFQGVPIDPKCFKEYYLYSILLPEVALNLSRNLLSSLGAVEERRVTHSQLTITGENLKPIRRYCSLIGKDKLLRRYILKCCAVHYPILKY